jgi:hypothetical protein
MTDTQLPLDPEEVGERLRQNVLVLGMIASLLTLDGAKLMLSFRRGRRTGTLIVVDPAGTVSQGQ